MKNNLLKNSKNGWIALLLVIGLAFNTHAQKVAVVDITTVLESLDEYKKAQEDLDRVAAKWRQEIAQEYDRIKGMYNKYQAEQVLLSDETRRQREDEITEKEKQVRDLQRVKFGPEGELFQRRQELVQPIQEKVYQVIESYASDKGLDLVLDRSSAAGLIFSKPDIDITEDIVKRVK
ncbi:MAG: OmpH family outer membrane protein [Saprospiraceae bacterium]|nr:OmpH family outer membrane protein [Saprospiraceae bacterium]